MNLAMESHASELPKESTESRFFALHSLPLTARACREKTILLWVNTLLSPPVASLAQISNGDTLLSLVLALGGRLDDNSHEQMDTLQQAADAIQTWLGLQEPVITPTDLAHPDTLKALLSFLHLQHIARLLSILQPTLCTQYPHISSAHIPPIAALVDLQPLLSAWTSTILKNYIDASLIPSIRWQDGRSFLALVHYHNPSLVPDLQHFCRLDSTTHTTSQAIHTLSTAFQLAYTNLGVPLVIDPVVLADPEQLDEQTIAAYLIEFLRAVQTRPPSPAAEERRKADLARWREINADGGFSNKQQRKRRPSSPPLQQQQNNNNNNQNSSASTPSTPSLSSTTTDTPDEPFTSTTRTSTFSVQQFKLTKTTTTKTGERQVPDPLKEFESRATTLSEKITRLQSRLDRVVPTRSNYAMSSSATMDSFELASEDGEISSPVRSNDGEDVGHTRVLHPLRAAREDLSAYETNVRACRTSLPFIEESMAALRQYVDESLEPEWQEHQSVLSRLEEIDKQYQALVASMDTNDDQLARFRRGFLFARSCSEIRAELDVVQTKMVKAITTDTDIQELETRVKRTSERLKELGVDYADLLDEGLGSDDDAYKARFEAITKKNDLVCTWVEEVRVWFAEAERIRQWIQIRIERLGETTVPDAMAGPDTPATNEVVNSLNAQHSVLEDEIEHFDAEDMARLRSHVKDLTGAGRADKDLSPADTTTIDITLTTLKALDKLMHSLRRKSLDLQALTRRVAWEKEHVGTMDWLTTTDAQVYDFLTKSARWQAEEDDCATDETDQEKTDRLAAKERLRDLIIQNLLSLEQRMNEFDQGQFSRTINLYEDLEDIVNETLPDHISHRQLHSEALFDNLLKRTAFARQVVEQRLSVMDSIYQIDILKADAHQITLELAAAEETHGGENELTAKVQAIHERILQLATATSRVVYPEPVLDLDRLENEQSNNVIRQVMDSKRAELIDLAEELDSQLNSLCYSLELHREGKELVQGVDRLCLWVDSRSAEIKNASVDGVDPNTISIDDVRKLEKEHHKLVQVLEEEKENEAADLLIRIQTLLETADQVGSVSVDRDELKLESRRLTDKFDGLRHTLDEHEEELKALRQKMEDGNTYVERAKALKAFISQTRASIPGLKQTCGFMTGQSEEQDRQRFEMLNSALQSLKTAYVDQQRHYQDICTRFESMTPEKTEDREEAARVQKELEKDWAQLANDMDSFENFTEAVGQWYDRQRRMSIVDEECLHGLTQEIAHLAKAGWSNADLERIEKKLSRAVHMLGEAGKRITSANRKEDAVQTANYSCARDRHAALLNKAQDIVTRLNDLKKNANNAVAFGDFLERAKKLKDAVQEEHDAIEKRMELMKQRRFETMERLEIEQLIRATMGASAGSEARITELRQLLKEALEDARKLRKQGYGESAVKSPLETIESDIVKLVSVLASEKRQAGFVRKMQMHAKTAGELLSWISHCSNAISQLPTDVCITDENELLAGLDNLEHKMHDMQPIVTGFKAMAPKILGPTKDGLKHLEDDFGLSGELIQEAIAIREARVMDAWNSLGQQLGETRQTIEHSQHRVDIARKVKEIMTLIGEAKDRASAVRVCHLKPSEMGDNTDLKVIQTCSLSMLPTEQETVQAKAELDSLDRDIELRLQVAIAELDRMLGISAENEDIFSGQRAEIIEAVGGLTDMMKAKREAIAEAEKMEGFLTVVEELEVLLLAVAEVVDRASPEGARVVDGVLSRADLQAILIDLDTRYRYYEPKINGLMDEAKEAGESLLNDRRVVHCLEEMANKWKDLQALAVSKKSELLACIGPLADPFTMPDLHKRTLQAKRPGTPVPNRIMNGRSGSQSPNAASTGGSLQDRGQRVADKRTNQIIRNNERVKPQVMHSTPRYMASTGNTRARKNTITTGAGNGNVSPTARRVAQLSVGTPKPQPNVPKPEAYVADPKNDLDVALGLIVNDSPYKIKVEMVPGEVGRYWFGTVNPKLAYCRILRSRMVMVRVGGGWVELSQFLRDHALLEGGNFVPRASSSGSERGGLLGEVYLRTSRAASPGTITTIRGGGGAGSPGPLRESQSTPYNRGGSPVGFGHGIKEGNRFLVTVDGMGNQVEVKMTKANNKNFKFVTPRRTIL
ncbi:hypothetical protein PHYBLDRAFT_179018 [Phycomyces blakesleeanus NRRL 1555(-)]|uniref:GAR domain-containing protein n=2 Tax=Phycomyces blakesleeanus TaxID=4837 RepID=A0A167Q7A7_PHYB8|nr:hypothetical protein PHYBLDRAFT_179018 [Phycomyces blakesleeanus NRRL 1555(-)]OAD79207.1 hypothetical protein PHYBLDRAFT_179018 [Phycomyces blakesleeanus NRRL 1555(-)]|eukprot:XP_018297247.1 hypothetical protein PHYBLDRAFT_179018 [Phycomyces blakesleeanus NRRL 1555(-)]